MELTREQKLADEIITDLCGRGVFRHAWDSIDEETGKEILDSIANKLGALDQQGGAVATVISEQVGNGMSVINLELHNGTKLYTHPQADPKLAERCNLASRDADLPVAHQCLFHEAAVALGGGK